MILIYFPSNFDSYQAPWVYITYGRIFDISKQIYPAPQPNRIGGDVSSCLGIVISEVIVMQSRLLVVILAREAEGILDILNRNRCLAEGGVNCLPRNCLVLIRQNLGRAQMVVVEVIN